MARTKQRVLADRLDRQQRAALADRAARRRAGILRAARILSSQEAAQLRVTEQGARSQETGEASTAAEEEEDEHSDEVHSAHGSHVCLYPAPCVEMRLCAGVCAQACCSRSPRAPAASGYAYGSRRRSGTAAVMAQEEEEDGWADEARGVFREREGRRSLVDGNARSCGQDGLVTVATLLGVKTSKDAVRCATLPPAGDTPVGVIRAYAAGALGIGMRSLKDHSVLGVSLWEQPGGAEHQLILLEAGVYYVELMITMPKAKASAKAKVDRHVVVFDADFRRCDGELRFYGVIKDNYGAAKLLQSSDRAWLGKPQPPPARAMWRSLSSRPLPKSRSTMHGCVSGWLEQPHEYEG